MVRTLTSYPRDVDNCPSMQISCDQGQADEAAFTATISKRPVMTSPKLRLGVNVDHVATIRNARGGWHPDPVRAAQIAIAAGADGITAHLREDRRHIRGDAVRAGLD